MVKLYVVILSVPSGQYKAIYSNGLPSTHHVAYYFPQMHELGICQEWEIMAFVLKLPPLVSICGFQDYGFLYSRTGGRPSEDVPYLYCLACYYLCLLTISIFLYLACTEVYIQPEFKRVDTSNDF